MEGKQKTVANRLLRAKLGYRMFFIYVLGGVLPMVLIVSYLIAGTNKILVQQAEDTELTELETVKRQLLEVQNTLSTLSEYFYFNESIERLATRDYDSYQELVDDYRGFDVFEEHRKYYNDLIERISIFFDNQTLKSNFYFIVADDEVWQEEWYQRVREGNAGIVWTTLPYSLLSEETTLVLTRALKSKKKEDVGVLAIYLRPERIADILRERDTATYIVLDGEKLTGQAGDGPDFAQIQEFLPGGDAGGEQRRVMLDGEEYVITCVTAQHDASQDYLQIVSMKSVREILAGAREQSARSGVIAGVSILAATAIILVFSSSFGRRVEHFRGQMQKAAAGNFALEERLGGNDEISELYDYLNEMILQIRRLLAEVYRERLHAEQLKASQKDAEFKMLASQINPHFLYNTLETIRMKARVNKQYEIEELVKMLAALLRRSIQAGEQDVPVRSEVELMAYYLKIQQYRFGDRIQYSIEVEEGERDRLIMPLILQPIVENAIVHGLEDKAEEGHIAICVRREGEFLLLTIEDDGMGIPSGRLAEIRGELEKGAFKGEHIGICNVGQRIRLKYGGRAGLSINSEEGKGTRVEIRIPL